MAAAKSKKKAMARYETAYQANKSRDDALLDASLEVAIAKSRAVSNNQFISRFTAAAKSAHDLIERDAERMEEPRRMVADAVQEASRADARITDVRNQIEDARKTASKTTDKSALGRALISIRDLHREWRDLENLKTSRLARRSALVPLPFVSGGAEICEGFHQDRLNPLCFAF